MPILIPVIFFQHVRGDVYDVDDSMCKHLDKLEGHPHYYLRQDIDIILDGRDDIVQCQTYVMTDYKPDLLNLECYDAFDSVDLSSQGIHYVPPCDRPPGLEHWKDIKKNITC